MSLIVGETRETSSITNNLKFIIMKNSISTQYGLFLVEFHGVIQQFIFSGNAPEELGDLIQEHGKYGILAIKRFDTAKSRFKKISKDEVERFFGWDTHSIEQLKAVNYLKK